MFYTLTAEGVIESKPPEQINENDFDMIDGRLLLEDVASKEGQSVDELFDAWETELETATSYSSLDEFMEMLRNFPDQESNK